MFFFTNMHSLIAHLPKTRIQNFIIIIIITATTITIIIMIKSWLSDNMLSKF